MTYFEDLSLYEYSGSEPGTLNIGWLAKDRPFATGDLPPGFLERLAHCTTPFSGVATAGVHRCDLCPGASESELAAAREVNLEEIRRLKKELRSRSAGAREALRLAQQKATDLARAASSSGGAFVATGEVRIRAGSHVFGAPAMLIHYIEAHRYRPPQVFIDAVLEATSRPLG